MTEQKHSEEDRVCPGRQEEQSVGEGPEHVRQEAEQAAQTVPSKKEPAGHTHSLSPERVAGEVHERH